MAKNRLIRRIALVALFIHASLLAYLSWPTSPNRTEVEHIEAAVYLWHTGQLDVFHVNPPLVRAVAAPIVLLPGFRFFQLILQLVMVPGDKNIFPIMKA